MWHSINELYKAEHMADKQDAVLPKRVRVPQRALDISSYLTAGSALRSEFSLRHRRGVGCACVSHSWVKSEPAWHAVRQVLGADDLIPIIVYCVVQAATPQSGVAHGLSLSGLRALLAWLELSGCATEENDAEYMATAMGAALEHVVGMLGA